MRSVEVARSNKAVKNSKTDRAKKAQSALEYLVVYSWAIVIAVVIISVLYFFVLAPSSSVPSTCVFAGGAYCQDIVFGSNAMQSSIVLFLTNPQQYSIAMPQFQINSSSFPVTSSTCSPNLVLPGGAMICNLTISQQISSLGSLVTGKIIFSAIPCPSANLSQCQAAQRQNYTGSFTTHTSPLLSAVPTSLSISAAQISPAANGDPDTISAAVKILGLPISGATVSFMQSNSFATLNPSITTTDSNGNAFSYISSMQTGYTLVTATFAGVSDNVLINFTTPAYVLVSAPLAASGSICSSQNGGVPVLTIDSQSYTCSQFPLRLLYQPMSSHSYNFASPVSGPTGIRFNSNTVTGCGAFGQSGSFSAGAAGSNCTINSNYNGQYYLMMQVNPIPGGTVVPSISDWYAFGNIIPISASPNSGYTFLGWSGTGTGNYTGSSSSSTVTLSSPITEQANFQSTSTTSTSSTSTTSLTITSTSTSTTSTTINYIYCVGNGAHSPLNGVYSAPISSTGIGAWTATTNYPIEMYNAGCSISNGYVYCVGSASGLAGNQTYYAPISGTGVGTWTVTTSYPIWVSYAGCSIYNSYIYCVGSRTSPMTQVYYSSVSSTGIGAWTATTSYPLDIYDAGCSISNGYIYCVGTGDAYSTKPYQVYYAPISSTGVGAWAATTKYPVPFSGDGCSIFNSYLYCLGGEDAGDVYYAPVSSTGVGTWTTTKSYPVPLENAGCSISNGYIYCVGTLYTGENNDAYYAPVSSTGVGPWTSTTQYPVSKFYAAYCQIPGSGGGYYGGGPSSGPWASTTSTSTTSTSTSTSSTTTTILNYIYCVGSITGAANQVYYAPISSTGVGAWTSSTNYPVAINDEGCSIYSSNIYCVGSNYASANQVYYAPISSTGVGTWAPTTFYPAAMQYAGCSTYNGYIYCVGIVISSRDRVYYAPVSSTGIGTWTLTTDYPIATVNEAGCSISNGYIYCVGSRVAPDNHVYYAPISSTGVGAWTYSIYPINFNRAGCSIYNSYIYCVGTSGVFPNNQVYYAPVSSTGVGTWTPTMNYPVKMYEAGCSILNSYIYCVGTGAVSPYTQVYYAPVSSTGVGTWTFTTSYPIVMNGATTGGYCEIPGSGGGYFGGGGPSTGPWPTTTTTTTSTSTTSTSTSTTSTSTTSTSTTSTSTSTSTTSTTTSIIAAGYIYCVGTASGGINNQVYTAPISNQGLGPWTGTTTYPIRMFEAGCSIYNAGSNGNYIYCVGSLGGNTGKEVYYAPISSTGVGTWTSTTNYPVGMDEAGCSIYNSYIYCVGTLLTAPYNYAYYAAISSTGVGTWSTTTNYPVGKSFSGCSISGGYIYCVGTAYAAPFTQVYYAPVSSTGIGTWITTTNYPIPMYTAGCSVYNNIIYCVGSSSTYPYTQIYYAPISSTGVGTWTFTTKYPYQAGMVDAGCAILNSYIYCVGEDYLSPYNQVFYAPVSSTGIGTWISIPSYPIDMYGAYCEIPGSGGGYLGGGGPSSGP